MNIAIDGPSGAGKSSISRALASKLGYIYVDTGALYRTVVLGCMKNGVPLEDVQAVTDCLPSLTISLTFVDGVQHVLLDGQDVSDDIRTPEISQWASKLSSLPVVRAFLFSLQQSLAREHDVIMDGRDIGTVILPNAQIKIFLTASPEDRAARRFEELRQKGVDCDYDTVLSEVKERDHRDRTREISPTKPAKDAAVIDTTGNTFEQSVTQLYDHIREKLSRF